MAHTCHVRLVWDFQRLVLVQVRDTDAPATKWLWLEPGASVQQWVALRRALVHASARFTEPLVAAGLEGQR